MTHLYYCVIVANISPSLVKPFIDIKIENSRKEKKIREKSRGHSGAVARL